MLREGAPACFAVFALVGFKALPKGCGGRSWAGGIDPDGCDAYESPSTPTGFVFGLVAALFALVSGSWTRTSGVLLWTFMVLLHGSCAVMYETNTGKVTVAAFNVAGYEIMISWSSSGMEGFPPHGEGAY
jgi:hypothetical protein